MKFARTALCLSLVIVAEATEAPSREIPRLRVAVSKNVELFAILAGLTPEWDRMVPHSRQAVATRQRFLSFREHRAVQMTWSLLQQRPPGSLMRWALRVSEFPEARLDHSKVPLFSRMLFAKALSAARDFYRESGFEDYWAEFRPVGARWAEEAEKRLALIPIVETAEHFFGTKKDDYVLIFTPHAAGLRTRDVIPTERGDLAAVIFGPGEGITDGSSPVDARALALEVALREFCQIWVGGIVEAQRKMAKRYAHLQERARRGRENQEPAVTWMSFWTDNLTAAVHARLALAVFGPEAAREVLSRIHQKDILASEIYSVCAEYEAERCRFPTFQSFLPELLSRLETVLAPSSGKRRR